MSKLGLDNTRRAFTRKFLQNPLKNIVRALLVRTLYSVKYVNLCKTFPGRFPIELYWGVTLHQSWTTSLS